MKYFNHVCRKYANPLLCCFASTVIIACLIYFVLSNIFQEGLLSNLFKEGFNLFREGFTGANEFVLYHMKGCPHCTKMMPEWSKFESSNKSGVKTRSVEQSEVPNEIKKHGISGFPSLLLLDGKGNKIKDYNGPRTANAFAEFCSQNSS
jgi:thiol-disulfide isomerase/thioredoxin